MAKAKLKINEISLDDALDLLGILSIGGLNPQVRLALREAIDSSQAKRPMEGAAIDAVTGLLMSALANRDSRDQLRTFLFHLWRSPQDEKAKEDDLDEFGHVEGDLYQEKLKAWRKLSVRDLKTMIELFVKSDFFKDFLGMLREDLSGASGTESNGSTGLEAVR